MRIITARVPGVARLARIPELSRMARQRLKWMDYYQAHGRNAALTCRYFGISRQTFYRWKRRYDPYNLNRLEERSHRPKRLRQPTWSRELALAVLHLREQYPRWGKDKLAVLLGERGWQVSTSMVGRILTRLKARGVLREPLHSGISTRKRLWRRPYAVRKPKGYEVKEPGDLVQVDTLDVRPLPGMVLKHFTARDMVSRWDVLEAHTRATATTAAGFLDALQTRMPFPVQAIQVDGGSEFQAAFETECQRRGLRLFVLPPRSPKLNGCVERAQRTHTEEFYEITNFSLDVATLNQELLAWEHTYNTIRPHQALAYLTPHQFVTQWQHQRKESKCH
ncbi:MAG: integrase core domain-containing protein [Dehalococcoidia bacterium]|nr:integrase core domain-containing protein [Dehalococcoidia bacterium]